MPLLTKRDHHLSPLFWRQLAAVGRHTLTM
jgi:hypothetical protein